MEDHVDVLEDTGLAFGIVLEDELLFTLLFWEEDLTIPADRDDLGELAGGQKITAPQKLLLLDRSRRVIACTGRKTIKTVNLESKIVYWSLWNRRIRGHDEALVVTPGQTHLNLLMDRVFPRVNSTSLFSLFCPPEDQLRGSGLQRWRGTNIWVHWKLEGISGTDKNMAGIRAKWIIGDEMAYGNNICHASRVQTALPRCPWIYSGVPNFTQSPFRRIDEDSPKGAGEGWSHHKGSTIAYNPLYWSDEARRELINSFDGVEDPNYQTQVLGIWTSHIGASAWPPGCFNLHSASYFISNPAPEDVNARAWGKILRGFNPPHRYFVIGWDYGYSPDPAVLLVLGSNDLMAWYAVGRFRFREVALPDQVELIKAIAEKSLRGRAVMISSDHRPATQQAESQIPWLPTSWSEPQGSTDRVDTNGDEMLDEEGKVVSVRNKEFYSELSRDAMSYALLKAPYYFYLWLYEEDHELIDELSGTSSTRTASGYLVYHAKDKTPGSKSDEDHNTDALRFACDAAYRIWEHGLVGEDNVTPLLGVVEVAMPGQLLADPTVPVPVYAARGAI